MTEPEDRRAVYNQDSEFYRYQDRLRWSRFQTIMTIEGAWLLALYVPKLPFGRVEQIGLGVFGFLVILVQTLLCLKDEVDANNHLERLGEMEDEWGLPFAKKRPPRPSHKALGDKIVNSLRGILPSGSTLTVTLVAGITIFNLFVIAIRVHPAAAVLTVIVVSLVWALLDAGRRRKGKPGSTTVEQETGGDK